MHILLGIGSQQAAVMSQQDVKPLKLHPEATLTLRRQRAAPSMQSVQEGLLKEWRLEGKGNQDPTVYKACTGGRMRST